MRSRFTIARFPIARRGLADARRSLVGWALGFAGYVGFIVAFYPTVHSNAEKFNELVASYPDTMMDVFLGGQRLDFSSGASFVNTYLFASMVPILILVLAITHGAASVAGEEQAGTLDLLLAQPVSRRSFVVEKAVVLMIELAAMGLVVAAVLFMGAPLVDLDISSVNLLLAVLGLVLLGVVVGMVACAVGAATGRRSMASGVAAAIAAGTYLINAMSSQATWLRPVRLISPFYWATHDNPVANGLDVGRVAVLCAMAAVAFAVALIGFERRDLGSR